MIVRPATTKDLEQCRRLDGSCLSETVWNMQQLSERDDITILLSEVRLPRPVEIAYPASFADLPHRLERSGCILVAEEDGICGWLAMSVNDACSLASVDHLIVSPERRREGIGTALLREAVKVAREMRLRVVLLACQAKNGPAIAFCRRLGLEFCGYNEQYFADHEVTLLFAYRVR